MNRIAVRCDNEKERQLIFMCPGCGCGHGIRTRGPAPVWTFNENFERPTIQPSVLASVSADAAHRCHSYVTDGKIQFLNDCGHALAGQTVDLPEIDW